MALKRDRLDKSTERFGTIESITEQENREEDEDNVEELEQTSKDYWGRSAQQTDGAAPTEPPDVDPLIQQFPERPKGPPARNM
jgi:hypothetical protein